MCSADPVPFRVEHEVVAGEPDVCVVRVCGEVDIGTAADLDRALQTMTARGARRIVLDLGAVSFLDSSGLHCLVRTARALAARGGGLTCAALSARARRTLEVTGLLELLTQSPAGDRPGG